jgi:hypothetical protein
MKGVHMDWPFLQDLAGGSKKKEIWLTFFLFRQEFLVGGLFDTRVSFLKKIVSFFLVLLKR